MKARTALVGSGRHAIKISFCSFRGERLNGDEAFSRAARSRRGGPTRACRGRLRRR
jgi:hypothetical protein